MKNNKKRTELEKKVALECVKMMDEIVDKLNVLDERLFEDYDDVWIGIWKGVERIYEGLNKVNK